jgi:hypothetical protein
MASILEKLGIATCGLEQTITPFKSWKESPVKEWKIVLRMLTTGELVELAEKTAHTASSAVGISYLSKVYLLATALVSINNQPVATDEDVENHNKEYSLFGAQKISLYDYKVILIKKLSEPVVNTLVIAYDSVQDQYMRKHFGENIVDSQQQKSDLDLLSKVPNNESPEASPERGETSSN